MKTILQKFVFTWLFNAQKRYPTSLEKIIILKTTCKIFLVNYHNSKKAKHELRVQVTSSVTRVTSSNPRVTSSNTRVRRLKARVKRLKALVETIKSQVK